MRKYVWLLLFVIVLLGTWSACFTVDETEYAIVTRFGAPAREIKAPGLYFKLPAPIDRALKLDHRLLVYDLPERNEPPREFLTHDKKNIEVSAYACWRIDKPLRFLETVRDRGGAEARLGDVITSELGKTLSTNDLSALISTKPEEMRLHEVMSEIKSACAARVGEEYGVEIVDFRIKRINFPEQNRRSVFDRMRAERKRIATRHRSEGEELATKIRAEADRKRAELLSDAERQATEVRGRAEAEAMRIANEAHTRDPEFYEFLRSLQSYETSLREGTTLVLPADSEYLKWMNPAAFMPSAPGRSPVLARPTPVSPDGGAGGQ